MRSSSSLTQLLSFFSLWAAAFGAPALAADLRPNCTETFPSERSNCLKPWTVLVYMRVAPDLQAHAFADLYEMEAGYESGRPWAGSTRQSDWVTEVNIESDATRSRLHIRQSELPYRADQGLAHFSNLTVEQLHSPSITITADAPLSEADRLRDFLRWGVQSYPAHHYAVIFWGHGRGWSDQSLTTLHLRTVLSEVRDLDLDFKPFDLVAWDACWMQSLEVTAQLIGAARYVVGSAEQFDPVGLPYRRLAYRINSAPLSAPIEPATLAREIPLLMKSSLELGGLQRPYATRGVETLLMNALSSDELYYYLLPSLRSLSQQLVARLQTDEEFAADLKSIIDAEPRLAGSQIDLGVFLRQLEDLTGRDPRPATPEQLIWRETLWHVRTALDRTVLSRVFGTRYSSRETELYLKGFRGLSFWLTPSDREFAQFLPHYRTSLLYQLLPEWEVWQTELRLH